MLQPHKLAPEFPVDLIYSELYLVHPGIEPLLHLPEAGLIFFALLLPLGLIVNTSKVL